MLLPIITSGTRTSPKMRSSTSSFALGSIRTQRAVGREVVERGHLVALVDARELVEPVAARRVRDHRLVVQAEQVAKAVLAQRPHHALELPGCRVGREERQVPGDVVLQDRAPRRRDHARVVEPPHHRRHVVEDALRARADHGDAAARLAGADPVACAAHPRLPFPAREPRGDARPVSIGGPAPAGHGATDGLPALRCHGHHDARVPRLRCARRQGAARPAAPRPARVRPPASRAPGAASCCPASASPS